MRPRLGSDIPTGEGMFPVVVQYGYLRSLGFSEAGISVFFKTPPPGQPSLGPRPQLIGALAIAAVLSFWGDEKGARTESLNDRGASLPAGEPGHSHRFATPCLVAARGQPRTVPGQRQDRSLPRPASRLLRVEHPAAAPGRGRSASRRPDRTLLRNGAGAVGSRGASRSDANADEAEPCLDGLVGSQLLLTQNGSPLARSGTKWSP